MKKLVLMLALVPACASTDDDRICLDWDSRKEIIEDCTPLYGNIICVQKEKTRYWCVLYSEDERTEDEKI